VLVVDDGGRFNLFTVMAVAGDVVDLQLRDPVLAASFGPGASVAGAVVESYAIKTDPAAQDFQLLEYDGYRSEQPVSDDIVGMRVGTSAIAPPSVAAAVGSCGTMDHLRAEAAASGRRRSPGRLACG
jgi:hypothetical protein